MAGTGFTFAAKPAPFSFGAATATTAAAPAGISGFGTANAPAASGK